MLILNGLKRKDINMEHVRIVCANVHNASGEIEIVVEINKEVNHKRESMLASIWIDKSEVVDRIME
jgi:hypothetical protein